jgi:hypothetical protein
MGALESKTVIATVGRAAMLFEWRLSGDDTQTTRRTPSAA